MKVFNVGPDELYDKDSFGGDYVWLVYWYEGGSWDGSGEAVALGKDGRLYSADLGHCSCYGPAENGFDANFSVEEFLKDRDSVHGRIGYKEVEEKVIELLNLRD